MEQTRVQVIPGTVGRVALVRLRRNTDLVTGLIEACKQAGFKMASVQMMIGSLRSAEISWTKSSPLTKRGSERTKPQYIPGPVEFIAGQAQICLVDPERPVFHVHGVLTDSDGKAWGGHFFQGGNPIHSTMDVVMTEIQGAYMKWFHDEEIDLELPVPCERAD